jgi:hypothetical protein
MKKHIALLLGGAELLAAAAVGLTVRAAPAHAAPTQNGANLFVTQTLADPGVMRYEIFGDDDRANHRM